MERLDNFISRLEGVRRTGNGRYVARCPAHADRSPSLSLKATDNGDVLLHCFASCEFGDIIAALGLTAADCFADSGSSTPRYRARHKLHAVESEFAILRSRYGFSPETAKALVSVGMKRQSGGLT